MLRFVTISLTLTLLGAVAQAQTAAPNVRQACAADRERLCGSAPHGQRRGCMREHWNEVSQECKSAMMARREGMRPGRSGSPSTPPPSDEANAN